MNPRFAVLILLTTLLTVPAAHAITVGSGVAAVGGGYSRFYGTGSPEFLYTDPNGINLAVLDDSGLISSTVLLVTNVSPHTLCIASDGYIYFSEAGGIWKRNTKATNPFNFNDPELKNQSDPNAVFRLITSEYAADDMTPIGNRIYFIAPSDPGYNPIKFIDITTHSLSTLAVFDYQIYEIAANDKFVYALEYNDVSYYGILHVIDHSGVEVQTVDIPSANVISLLLEENSISVFYSDGGGMKCFLYANKTINTSSCVSASSPPISGLWDTEVSEMIGTKYAVFVNNNGQAETYVMESVFMPDYGSDSGDGTDSGSNVTYGDPNSQYIVELDKTTIFEGQSVKIYVKDTEDGYVEGANIYLDGVSTGLKTEFHGWWEWFLSFFGMAKPYAELMIDSAGTHYIHAEVKGVPSRAAQIDVLSTTGYTGGTENGSYPSTPPEQDGSVVVTYKLWADKTVVYKQGTVTFRVYKLENGEERGTVAAEIYVDGNLVGETKDVDPNPFAAVYELKYTFSSPGTYDVYAVVDGKQTGVLTITVLSSLDELPPTDTGTAVNLTVKVVGENNKPLEGIFVQRFEGDQLREQRITNEDGIAVLHPISGTNYTILAVDPGNNYLPVSRTGSWTSDAELLLEMRKAGDINDDGDIDVPVTAITIRIDGSFGGMIPVGDHVISVVDQLGRELSGAAIYINGEYVGETKPIVDMPFAEFFVPKGLKIRLEEGSYTIRAIYGELADIAYIRVTDPNSYLLAWKLVNVPDQSNAIGFAGVGAGIGAIAGAVLGGGIGAIPGAIIGGAAGYGANWIWDQIDHWFKEWQYGDAYIPLGSEVEFAILQNGEQKLAGELYINGEKVGTFLNGSVFYTFAQLGTYNITAIKSDGEPVENSDITFTVGTSTIAPLYAILPPLSGNPTIDLIAYVLLGVAAMSLIAAIIRAVLG